MQGILADMKQRKWWILEIAKYENLDGRKYKHDYLMALFIHSLENAIMVAIPMMIFGTDIKRAVISFFTLLVSHFVIDHLKCNKFRINLVQDQMMHFVVILLCWFFVIL